MPSLQHSIRHRGAEAFIGSGLPRWRSLLQELVRTPSTFEHEHAVVKLVSNYLESLGIRVKRVPHRATSLNRLAGAQPPLSTVRNRSSLVARVEGSGGGPSLAINTHLDTVPAGEPSGWTKPPFSGYIDPATNVLYGRGAMDDKAGVVISLAVLETLVKAPVTLGGDVVFHYVLEDETTGNGTLLCLESGHTADAALVLDGTRLDKAIGQHAGNLQFEVQVRGRPASVSVSHMGINAAEMAARLVLELRDAFLALNAGRSEPWTRFPSPYQLVVQQLHAVGSQLTVPESASAQCYVTFPPPLDLAAIRQLLEDEVADFARRQRLPVPPELVWNGFATEPVCGQSPQLENLLQSTAAGLGLPPIDVGPSTGTSDLRHFADRGIPCVLYGPGRGFNPHRPDEHYYLDDLPTMIRFYVRAAQTFCSSQHARRKRAA
jgi:acetylornithine deacetylase